jgi:hypothetical protein
VEDEMMDANVLFRQLGGNRFRAMTGAKDFMKDGNSLRMKIMKNNTGGNHLIITLNSNDLYDMRFESHRLNRKTYELTVKVKAEEKNIPASNLQRVFTELSGLYTRMAEQSGVEGDPHDVKNFDKWCQTCGSYDKNPTLPEGYCDDCICVSCNETSSSGPSYAYCEICYEQENPDDTDYDKSGSYAEQSFNADDLKFKDWADQEMKTHGKKESFDDWLDDELKSHGDNVRLQKWGHHELDSHYERYGAESFSAEDSGFNPVVLCKTCGYETTIMGWPRGKNKYTCSCEKWGDNDIVVICKSCNKETTYRGYEYGYCGCSRSKNAESFNAETTMTVQHKDGPQYRYSETEPIYGETGEIVGHVSEITDEKDTPYQKVYGRKMTRGHNFYFDAETKSLPYKWIAGAIALGISLPYISSLLNSGRKK